MEIQQATFENTTKIIPDIGTAFTASVFTEYCTKQGPGHLHITSGMPKLDGKNTQNIFLAVMRYYCNKDNVVCNKINLKKKYLGRYDITVYKKHN